MRFSIFATFFLFLIIFAFVTVEARYRLKYPKGEFRLENGMDARVRRSMPLSSINSIKLVKRFAEFNPEEGHDETINSMLQNQDTKRGEGIA